MKDLQVIKDEYAEENDGVSGWDGQTFYSEESLNEIAERYAQEAINNALQEAAEKAREEMLNCEPTPDEIETFILSLQIKDQ